MVGHASPLTRHVSRAIPLPIRRLAAYCLVGAVVIPMVVLTALVAAGVTTIDVPDEIPVLGTDPSASYVPPPEPAMDPDIPTVSWRLSGATEVEHGSTVDADEGTLTSGRVIECQACTDDGQKGTVRWNLYAFSPAYDQDGQKAGLWYLKGDWTLTIPATATEPEQVRSGTVWGRFGKDPLTEMGDFKIPITQVGSGTASGGDKCDGCFEGFTSFEGRLVLQEAVTE